MDELLRALQAIAPQPTSIKTSRQYSYTTGSQVRLSVGNSSVNLAIGQGRLNSTRQRSLK